MQTLRKFFSKKRTGLLLTAAVVMFVVCWRVVVLARQPSNIFKIADEIGSVAQTREGVYPNRSGTSVVFYQETEMGMGTYLHVIQTGKTHLLYEQPEKGYGEQYRRIGWSPDEKYFLYAAFADESDTNGLKAIFLCDGNTGETKARIPSEAYAINSQFLWLTPRSFTYSAFNQRSWLVFEQDSSGKWNQTQVVKRFTEGKLDNLTAIGPKTIAWRKDGEILTYNFATTSSEKIWESSTNNLRSFSFVEESGNLLLNCTDQRGSLTITYRPPKPPNKEGAILSTVRNPKRVRYADLDMRKGRYTFTLKTSTNAEPSICVWDGMLRYHSLAGEYLFFTGNKLDGVPGIWRYDIQSKNAKLLVSGLDRELQYAKIIPPTFEVGTNSSGREIGYHLWKPTQVSTGKKHPIILGQALHVWNPFPQIAANAGYYYASAQLTNWINPMDTWPEDVTGMYEILARDPNVDTNRVYFIAYSAQANSAARVLASKPELCEGLILMRPGGPPELSNIRRSRILMIGGTDDKDAPTEYLRKYQNDAANLGIPVSFLLQDGVQHVIRSVSTEREQVVEFTKFLTGK